MSHERYPIEDRLSVPFKNESWREFSGLEYRYPNQFGEAVLVEGVNCLQEEADQLKARGAIFPLETAEPMRANFYNQDGERTISARSVTQEEVFDSRSQSIGFNTRVE